MYTKKLIDAYKEHMNYVQYKQVKQNSKLLFKTIYQKYL